jgi:hypothetical protein
MNSDPQFAHIDYRAIKFPSDQITIADIRIAHPERFDVENASWFKRTQDDPKFSLNVILYLERLLARTAFQEAIGKPLDMMAEWGLDRTDCLDELTRFYATYGIAQGVHHTEQLVRDLEAQATAQANSRPR